MGTARGTARAETLEERAFAAGAALCHWHGVLGAPEVPQAVLRARLALRAAEACMALAGRPERADALRDAVAFLQPGSSPGPAGEVYLSWRRAVERPVSGKALQRALPKVPAERIVAWLDAAGRAAPVERASVVLEAVLAERPRDPATALLLADAALAHGMGWRHVTPLLAAEVKRGDLRQTGEALRLACYRAVIAAVARGAQEAADAAIGAHRLREVAPKLRAKGADAAVELFLTQEAVAPTMLMALRSDRAARRFCDRLVALGAVRELTGRETFRLYGLAS